MANFIPPELLCEIFSMIRAETVRETLCNVRDALSHKKSPDDLLALTTTCYAWRHAALGYQPLWTVILSSYSPQIASWMVQNAGQLPLTFLEDRENAKRNATSTIVWSECHRLQGLHVGFREVAGANPNYTIVIYSTEIQEAQLLRALSLSHSHTSLNLAFGGFPNLRYFSINHEWQLSRRRLPRAPQLCAIKFNECLLEGTPSAASEILDTIRIRYANLSFLSLGWEIDRGTEPVDTIFFPNLSQLQLLGSCLTRVSLLAKCMRIPAACRLSIVVSRISVENERDHVDSIMNGLSNLVLRRTDGHVSALSPRDALRFAYIEADDDNLRAVVDRRIHNIETLRRWPWDLGGQKALAVPRVPAAIMLQVKARFEVDMLMGLDVREGDVEIAAVHSVEGEKQRTQRFFNAIVRGVLPLDTMETVFCRFDTLHHHEWRPAFPEMLAATTFRANVPLGDIASSAEYVCLPALGHLILDDVDMSGEDWQGSPSVLRAWLDQRQQSGASAVAAIDMNASQSAADNFVSKSILECQDIDGVEVFASEPSEVDTEMVNVQFIEFI